MAGITNIASTLQAPTDQAVAITGSNGTIDLSQNGIQVQLPATGQGSAGRGQRTVSTGLPSGGTNGDVWFQVGG